MSNSFAYFKDWQKAPLRFTARLQRRSMKSPFITKPRIGNTGRFLAVAVGEGRVGEGSRYTAASFEIRTSVWPHNHNKQRLAILGKLAKLNPHRPVTEAGSADWQSATNSG
jgi:hypothetical protein